ncbi:MAG: hypothetical protein KDN20_14175 [Verrucomicrobiae bacterium]|nr:hypothetical protein [Verrucomicrobiae bacterium]
MAVMFSFSLRMGKYGNGSLLSIPELREDAKWQLRRHRAKVMGSLGRTNLIPL